MRADHNNESALSSGKDVNWECPKRLFLEVFRSGPGYIGWKSPKGKFQQDTFQTTDEAIELIADNLGNANIWGSMATFVPGSSLAEVVLARCRCPRQGPV